MKLFPIYSPFFISFIFLITGVVMIATLCVSKALGFRQTPVTSVYTYFEFGPLQKHGRMKLFKVGLDQILQDDVNFPRHVLTLLVVFITAVLFTAAFASIQWVILPDATESVLLILHTVRLVLGLVVLYFASRRLPQR